MDTSKKLNICLLTLAMPVFLLSSQGIAQNWLVRDTFVANTTIYTIETEVSQEQAQVPKNEGIVEIPFILNEIAKCESGDRHFTEDGTVLRGYENSQDIGRWQINLDTWEVKAKELGYDVFDEGDNLLMALWIYKTRGVQDWRYSKSCWGEEVVSN